MKTINSIINTFRKTETTNEKVEHLVTVKGNRNYHIIMSVIDNSVKNLRTHVVNGNDTYVIHFECTKEESMFIKNIIRSFNNEAINMGAEIK